MDDPQRDRQWNLTDLQDAKPDPSGPAKPAGPRCPWCDSDDVVRTQRGFVGPTDERDQYLTCQNCGQVTYEIVSRTVRDMRMGQFQMGGTFRDSARQTKYTITRVLKVGVNEFLLYLKPVLPRRDSESSERRSED